MSYTWVAAALTLLQIIRIINVGSMRSMGDMKSPRRIATLCVLIINPAGAYLMTAVFSYGVWGIWTASLASQTVWFILSCIGERRCLKRLSG